MCLAVMRAALTNAGAHSAISLSTDDNVELITKSSPRSFTKASKHQKALRQRFSGLAVHVGLISFVKFLHLFFREAFHLFTRKLTVELSGVASSICITSLSALCSDMLFILTENFDSKRMAQGFAISSFYSSSSSFGQSMAKMRESLSTNTS